MSSYFIESFKIDKLWGYRDIDLTFHKDVNVLIGPNGSGKTTVLNLLHAILTADLPSLLNFSFDQAEIKLKGFKGRSVRTITAKIDATGSLLELGVGKKKIPLDIYLISRNRLSTSYRDETGRIVRRMLPPHLRRRMVPEEFYDELTALVPIVWLPVSRRLPVTEDKEEQYTRTRVLESVDLRLEELLGELSHYYSRLNTQLSERYKEFEHQVLSAILYSKEHDQLDLTPSLPTANEKDQLLGAFEASGLLNKQIHGRIDDHFAAAERVVKRINKNPNVFEEEDILVLPLISRTQTMVEYARKLERDRENIFASLRRYEKTVNSFLNDKSNKDEFLNNKSVEVDEDGNLKIKSPESPDLNWRHLSSGEKQILILLTEAMLRVDEPVVYIADEPELSLHVKWQEKLLESLVSLGGQKQIIVATHSPDIVGKFRDNVIILGKES